MIDGQAAYVEHCAGCHETGMMGAPREGEPDDWQGRSDLWQAVLMEHAKTGFFEMPARGGKSDLPDDVVSAAAEYMLEITFPDRPKD
jgi:cytochrome c5